MASDACRGHTAVNNMGVDYHAESMPKETVDWVLEVVRDLIDVVRAKVR